jgi:SAM-dependent methyltransferase
MRMNMKRHESYRQSHVAHDMAQHYESILSSRIDADIWQHQSGPLLAGWLDQLAGQGAGSHLDFACGTGRILALIGDRFEQLTGVDISAPMLDRARERFPAARLLLGDVTRQPELVSQQFDSATVFRFFANAEPELREEIAAWLAAHVRAGGVLIGNTHSHSWSWSGGLNYWGHLLLRRGARTLSRAQMSSLLDRHGFAVQRWEGFRIMPTISGRPVLGRRLQIALDKVARRLGMGFFGSDQLFWAVRR